jgi:hypothetical protein
MRSANLANRAARTSESGHVWEEKISGAQSSIEVEKFSTIRVRATGATTVTIDGVLAMTMASGEIEIMNVGAGVPDPNLSYGGNSDAKETVTVAIGGANAFVQVARNIDRQP